MASAPDHHDGEILAPGTARRRLPGWDCTAGLVAGPDAALLIDAGATLRQGAELRAWAGGLLARWSADGFPVPDRVTHLALTHPHFDHVLGAPAFAGVTVLAAVGYDTLPADEVVSDAVRHGVEAAAAAEAGDLFVRPDHLVSGERTVELGGGRQAVLANVGPGHTAHDLAVLVPGGPDAPDVVFCGDLVEESGTPQAGPDALPARWPAALDRLLALGGGAARYVPGHGAVVDAGFVRAQRAALAQRFGVS
ncbi:MBL fold metallo-hydrolase [Streptomyces sp. NPDC060194]|uniref:MBL fold metallo-hydrolase n=1 Tax=Streptomyces sp. NPDC060194 TaxID=3347069 RepID=UPI00365F6E90